MNPGYSGNLENIEINNGVLVNYESLNIADISDKLQVDMMNFQSYFNLKYNDEDELIKAQKERDLLMKTEGRNEFLKKQINGLILSSEYPANYFNQNTDPNNQYPRVYPYPQNNNYPLYSEREHNGYHNFVGDDLRNKSERPQGKFCDFLPSYFFGLSYLLLFQLF
jgi:hypothetical protein